MVPKTAHAIPQGGESESVQTINVENSTDNTKYIFSNITAPNVFDKVGTTGSLLLARKSEHTGNRATMSIKSCTAEKGKYNAYIEACKYNFVGISHGNCRQSSRNVAANVSSQGMVLHNNPDNEGWSSQQSYTCEFQLGCRVAFALPLPNANPEIGSKRFLHGERVYSPLMNDGFLVRRSMLDLPLDELVTFVEGQIGGTGNDWKALAEAVGFVDVTGVSDTVAKAAAGDKAALAKVAYAAELACTFGISLSNLHRFKDATAIRVLISAP